MARRKPNNAEQPSFPGTLTIGPPPPAPTPNTPPSPTAPTPDATTTQPAQTAPARASPTTLPANSQELHRKQHRRPIATTTPGYGSPFPPPTICTTSDTITSTNQNTDNDSLTNNRHPRYRCHPRVTPPTVGAIHQRRTPSHTYTGNLHQHTWPSRQWHRRPWHRPHSPAPPPPRAGPGTPGVANGLNKHQHHQHHQRRTGTTHKPVTSPPPTTNTPPATPHGRQRHHGTYHTSTTGGDVGHTTCHLQHPRHHRRVRPTNVTPQRQETTPSPSIPPATPHTPIRHPRHAHQPSPRHQCPRHQRHQHHRRRRQRQQLTHPLATINHSPTPTSSTLTPIPPSPTTPPPTQSSTPAPTPPSPPTSPPPPKGQGSRGTERQSEHATNRTRRPPYRTPLRNTPPRFPRQDVRSSPLLGRRLRRPPGHPTPTGSRGPAPTSPPATHGTA